MKVSKHKFKISKVVLLILIIVFIVSACAVFFRFKDYYISGVVVMQINDKLLVDIDKSTFSLIDGSGDRILLYYKDISKFKEGDRVSAITRPTIAASDPPIVDAYWIF